MIFDPKYQPELIASTDATRPYLIHVELDVTGKRMLATDGHRLVVVPCEPQEHDTSGPVTGEALKGARKFAKRAKQPTTALSANGALVYPGVTLERPSRGDAQYPPVDRVIPGEPERSITISFNPKYLYELALALGTPGCVKLRIDRDDSTHAPITVNPGEPAFAVLMPPYVSLGLDRSGSLDRSMRELTHDTHKWSRYVMFHVFGLSHI